MRDYAIVRPRFWTGRTGKELRGDADAQVVALYLMTCPSSSMTGMFYLPLPTIAHETGLTLQGASKALRRVCEAGFACYDKDEELVWVPKMARHQIEETLKPGDKRIKGVCKEVERFRKSQFYPKFYERYRADFNLPEPSPLEAPSEPHRSQEQDQEQDQEQEQIQKKPSPIASGGCDRQGLKCDPEKPLSLKFDFEAVYALYPRKEGKSKGIQRCRSQVKTREKYDELLAAVTNYARKVEGTDKQFIKQFDSFMSPSVWPDFVHWEPPPREPPKPKTWNGHVVGVGAVSANYAKTGKIPI